MQLVELEDPAEFLLRAGPLLLADEARHNLILGLAGTLAHQPGRYDEHRLWLVVEGDAVAAAALRTPPFNLVLARGAEEGIDVLAAGIGDALPGVVGAVPEVERFATAWSRTAGARPEVHMRQRIHACETVSAPPRPAPGTARPAVTADRALLLEWWRAFGVEAIGEAEPDAAALERSIDHALAAPEAGIALWEDGGVPVSATGFGSPTPSGIRIGPVYTPPARRGRGYASSLVAEISTARLASGRRFCFLYTDLANPTSNRIYADVGYRPVCDSLEIGFKPAGAG